MSFRKLLTSVLALSVALQPMQQAVAAPGYYFRNVKPDGSAPLDGPRIETPLPPGAGTNNEPASTEPVRGTGDLSVFGPVQVRARPGIPFSLPYTAKDAQGAVAWRGVGTPLPAGLALDPTAGVVEGSPAQVGSYAGIVVEGKDAGGHIGRSPALKIDVVPPPSVAVGSATAGQVGKAYSLAPKVQRAYGSQAWSYSGTLPLGIGLDSTTGVLSGTPRQSGTFDGISLVVVDADGATGRSDPFSIEVTSAIAVKGLQARYPVRLGASMSPVRPVATGTPGPYAWSLDPASPPLPAGLSLDAATGRISGTPSAAGTASKMLLVVRDTKTGDSTVSQPFAIAAAGAPAVSVGTLYTRRQGVEYGIQPVATNLLGTGYWRLTGSPGLVFSTATGSLTGKAGAPGTVPNLRIDVVDLFDGAVATSPPITLQTWPVFRIPSYVPVPGAQVGQPFRLQAPAASGVIGQATYAISGTVPPGLQFDAGTGVLSGTPTKEGRFEGLAFTVADSGDGARDGTAPFTIAVVPAGQPVPFAVNPVQDAYTIVADKPFSLTPSTVGAAGTVTWSLSGDLPLWAHFHPDTGTIEGTPPDPGAYAGFSLTARDTGKDATASTQSFGITVVAAAPLGVAYAAPRATVGEPYSIRASVTNSAGSLTYVLHDGVLPDGLSFDGSTGVIRGVPTSSGEAPGLVVEAIDASGAAAFSAPFTIAVLPSATSPSVSMASISGASTVPLSATPTVSNASAPYSWTLASGTLPAWASLDPATGRISGTPTGTGVADGLTLRVSDRYGRTAGTGTFSISITDAPVLTVGFPPILAGTLGGAFAVRPGVSGVVGGTRWAMASGTLPGGLTLDPGTGLISGNPNRIGTTEGLRVSVTLDNGTAATTEPFAVAVTASPVTIGTVPAQKATYGVPFALGAPSLSGATGAVSWILSAGALPAWAKLDPSTGAISGTPNALGAVSGLRIRATDANGATAVTTPFTLTTERPTLVATGPGDRVAFHAGAPASIPGPVVAGAVGALSYSISGTLPAGLTFDPATGAIAGRVNVPGGTDGLVVSVRDAFDGARASTAPFGIDIPDAPVVFVSTSYKAIRDHAFAARPAVSNAIGAQSWELASGTLPGWATLDPATGTISGTPDAVGTVPGISLRMIDAGGAQAVSATFSIVVESGVTASLKQPSYRVRVGVPFVTDPAVPTNTTGAVRYGVASGALPAWASVDPATGALSGTPTAEASLLVTLSVTDGTGQTGSATPFSLVSIGAPVVTTGSATLRAGAPLALVPGVSNAFGDRSWQLVQGTLPDGVQLLGDTGTLSGRPTAAGTYANLVVSVRDADGATGTGAPFSVNVTPGLVVTPPTGTVGGRALQSFSMQAFGVSNVKGAVTWSAVGNLPSGLRLNADGSLTGTPDIAGTYQVTLQAQDGFDQARAEATATLSIAQPYQVSGNAATSLHVGQAFATPALRIVGQRGAPNWTLTRGSLPSWATLDPATGIISGTGPGTAAVVPGLALTATDSTDKLASESQAFSLTVLDALAVTNLPTAMTARFGYPFTASTPVGLNVIGRAAWSWGGTPPGWAGLDAATGTISGTPDALSSTPDLTLALRDATGATASSVRFALRVFAQPSIRLDRTTYSLRVGDPLTVTPYPSGIVGAPNWSLVPRGPDPVPAGLAVDPLTGVLSGVADSAARASFALRMQDGADGATVDSQVVSLNVAPPFVIDGMKPSYFGRTQSFLRIDQPVPTGAGGNVTWSATGPLAQGLSGPDETGVISGVVLTPNGQQTIRLSGKSDLDDRTATAEFTISTLGALGVSGVSDVTVRNGADISALTYKPVARNVFSSGNGVWSLAGSASLPNGVTFDASTGRLAGSPSGYAAVTAFPGNVVGLTDTTDKAAATSDPFRVTVNPTLTLDTAQTAVTVRATKSAATAAPSVGGLVGNPTWRVVTQSGSAMPYTIDASGVLTLSPKVAGTWTYALELTDQADGAKVLGPNVAVSAIPPTTLAYPSNTTLAPGIQANIQPSPSGNLGALTYRLASGTLPNGLSVDASGAIVGQTSTLGAASVTIAGKDTDGYEAISNTIRISVTTGLDVFAGPVTQAKVGRPYSQTASASNVSGTLTWGQTGTLPTSLTFLNGVISGTPTVAGTFGNLAVTGKDSRNVTVASDPFAITVLPGNVVTAAAPAKWRVGLRSTMPLSVTNGTGSYRWSVASGSLPPGLALGADGAVSGVPTASGNYSAVIQSLDADGTVATLSVGFSVLVGPTVTYGQSRTYIPGDVVSLRPTVQNLIGAATYSVASGGFPDGISLQADGTISGTAGTLAAGVAAVVAVTDADGAVGRSPAFSLAVSNTGSYIDAPAAPQGKLYAPFSLTPTAYLRNQALRTSVTWYLAGSRLPQGLSFDSLSGTISGTPLEKGTFTYAYNATYSGSTLTSGQIALTIADRDALSGAFDAASYAGRLSTSMSIRPTATNAIGTPRWSVASGALPPGMSLSGLDGTVSGPPSATGTSTFALQVADAYSTAVTPAVTVTVAPAISATLSAVSSANRVGATYLANLTPSGNVSAVTWTVASGQLPPGVALGRDTGTLSGTLAASGTWPSTIRATETASGATTIVPFTLTVTDPPSIQAFGDQTGAVGANLAFTPVALNAAGTATWKLSGPTLPDGLAFSTSSGAITGTLQAATVLSGFVLTVTDGDGLSASSPPFSITFVPAGPFTVTVPADLNVIRGQPITVTPVTLSNTGAVRYELQALSGGTATTVGAAGATSGNYNMGAASALYAGLTFNYGTGVISGTPTSTIGTLSGNTATATFRVRAYETRSGGLTASSNQMVVLLTDWAAPSVSIPSNLSLTRFAAGGMTPTPTNVAAGSAVRYQLQYFDSYYGSWQDYSGTVNGSGCYLTQAQATSGILQMDTSAYSSAAGCTGGQFAGTNVMTGLTFNLATGAVSGTPSKAMTVAAGTIRQIRIALYETRVGILLPPAISNAMTISSADQAGPSVSLPATLAVTRGQPLPSAIPQVTGATGGLRYELYDVSGGGSVQLGIANATSGTYNMAAYSGSYAGLAFNYATGVISGTPIGTMGTLSGGTATASFRVRAVETRNGVALPAVSNTMSVTLTDWTAPTISLPTSLAAQRYAPASLTPTVSGVAPGSAVRYQVQYFDTYYGTWQDYSGTVNGSGCYLTQAQAASGILQMDTSAYSSAAGCTGGQFAGTNVMTGLTFNLATGVVSGTPSKAMTAAAGTIRQIRIALYETRQGVVLPAVMSNAATISATDYANPALSITANVAVTRGQPLPAMTVTPSGYTGTLRYELYDVSGGGSVQLGVANAATGTYNMGAYSGSYAGLAFNYATGVISGTPTGTMGTLSGGTATASFRIRLVETRNGTPLYATSNQINVTLTDWPAPSVTIPTTLELARFSPAAMTPSPNVQPGSAVRYQLQYFDTYYGSWQDYSGTVNGSGCYLTQAQATSGILQMDTSAYSASAGCTGGQFAGTSAMTGLTFNLATGAVSGTPSKAMTAAAGTIRQIRIALYETRQGVVLPAAISNAMTITSSDQVLATASLPSGLAMTRGTAVTQRPTTNATGTQRWALYDITGGGSSQIGTVGAASGTYSMGSFNALYAGLTFDYATGTISGTPTATFSGRVLRMALTETRNAVALAAVATNQMVASSVAAAPTVTISYGQGDIPGTIGQALDASPQVAGATATSYALSFQKFGSGGTPSAGEAYRTSLPGTLSFDPATGRISGSVPPGTLAAGAGNGSPNALVYRGMQVCINGSTTLCSDEIRIAIADRAKPVVSTPASTNVTGNAPFSIKPGVSGTVGTVTYSLAYGYGYANTTATGPTDVILTAAGQKPAWMAFDAASGTISGTPPVNLAARYRGLQVCGTDGQGYTACSGETVIVASNRAGFAIAYDNPVVTTQINKPFALPAPILTGNAVGAVTYTLALRAFGSYGTANATQTDLATKPAWLTLDPATGAMSGTVPPGTMPAGDGNASPNATNFRSWKVVGTDSQGFTASTQEVQIMVAERVRPTLDAPPFPAGQVNEPLVVTPSVGGEVNGTPTYSLVYGYGTFNVSNAAGPDDRIITAAGQMPSWLSFSTATGVLSGVPPVGSAGRYRGLQICLTDAQGYVACTGEVAIAVRDKAVFSITSPPQVQATVKQPFSTPALTSANAVGAVTYSLVPRAYSNYAAGTGETSLAAQPSWLALDATTGAMSGTVPVGTLTANGVPGNGSANATLFRNWRIKGTDSQGAVAYSDEFMLQVADRAKPTLAMSPVTNAQVNVAFEAAPTVSGLSGTATYSLAYNYAYANSNASGSNDTIVTSAANKPAWLGFSTASGKVSGTPTALGRYRGFGVCVADADGYVACSDEMVVTVGDRPALSVTWPGLGDAPIGQPFSQGVVVAYPAAAVTYTLEFARYGASGTASTGETYPASKPSWMNFDTATGIVSGTPPAGSAAMMRGMRIKATDGQATAYTGEVAIRIR